MQKLLESSSKQTYSGKENDKIKESPPIFNSKIKEVKINDDKVPVRCLW